eukprot:4056530-Pleurochrysis_carterae.AAC.2
MASEPRFVESDCVCSWAHSRKVASPIWPRRASPPQATWPHGIPEQRKWSGCVVLATSKSA